MSQQFGPTEGTYQGSTQEMGMQEGASTAGRSMQQPTQMGQSTQGAAGAAAQPGQQYEQMGRQTAQMGHGAMTHQSGATGPDVKLEDAMTDEMRVALHDFVQSATACEWCADRCIDEGPGMAECIRLCRDVADLATLNIQLIARDSIFGPEAAQLFAEAAEACAQECAQHHHEHCQECADVLSRAAQSTRKMLRSFGTGGMSQQPSQYQQSQGGQFQPAAGQQF